jgi:hypothetical protein
MVLVLTGGACGVVSVGWPVVRVGERPWPVSVRLVGTA